MHEQNNILKIDVNEIPDGNLVGTLHLEQTIKHPGDMVLINNKSYITVEKVHHYYYDGSKYQFAKTTLNVKPLENFC